MSVGERIKIARERAGISQEELARRLGLKDKSSVCKIEKAGDNISTRSIRRYAAALNLEISVLMGWSKSNEEAQSEWAKAREQELMSAMEDDENRLGTEGFALRVALYRMTKQELKNLYDVAKIMTPHAFNEEGA